MGPLRVRQAGLPPQRRRLPRLCPRARHRLDDIRHGQHWMLADRAGPAARPFRPRRLPLVIRSGALAAIDGQDESLRPEVVDFLTFVPQHILMLGKTSQNIATITFLGPSAMRAIVALPGGVADDGQLLAVPALLSGGRENAFVKRLWVLPKGVEEQVGVDVSYIQSKGYIWGRGD
jgi:hypothetical protein